MLPGLGRTGTMWASDQSDLKPDIITIGKGMGGGFPLSGLASSLKYMSATPFGQPSGSSSSYGGNPLAAAAGLGPIQTLLAEKLGDNSAPSPAPIFAAPKGPPKQYPLFGDR